MTLVFFFFQPVSAILTLRVVLTMEDQVQEVWDVLTLQMSNSLSLVAATWLDTFIEVP